MAAASTGAAEKTAALMHARRGHGHLSGKLRA